MIVIIVKMNFANTFVQIKFKVVEMSFVQGRWSHCQFLVLIFVFHFWIFILVVQWSRKSELMFPNGFLQLTHHFDATAFTVRILLRYVMNYSVGFFIVGQ